MSGLTTSRANVMLVMVGAVATPGELPVETDCQLVRSGDQFVVCAAQCKGGLQLWMGCLLQPRHKAQAEWAVLLVPVEKSFGMS